LGQLFIGLMSGTSLDGVDAAVVEFGDQQCLVREAVTTVFPTPLRSRLEALVRRPQIELAEFGQLDNALGEFFATCTLQLLDKAGLAPEDIEAVGHHGHTAFHKPDGQNPFTLQIGDPNVIVARTGITVVADFRRLDIALGGQGAPLMPAFHAWRFGEPGQVRAVVNIGGIANVTLLRSHLALVGFDTGPGNTLLDGWIACCSEQRFDRDGQFAASGSVDRPLLEQLLTDPFFARLHPKSTGREHFNMAWLEQRRGESEVSECDMQATLAELTALTIAEGVRRSSSEIERVILCGGGAHNLDLVARISRHLAPLRIESSADYGISPDWVEAAGFAWLARARLRLETANSPTVTGARQAATLGAVYWRLIGHRK
jgi:anhydro-N-acetylmuramic acid kinase